MRIANFVREPVVADHWSFVHEPTGRKVVLSNLFLLTTPESKYHIELAYQLARQIERENASTSQ